MMRILEISLVTLGDPDTVTGGYLYHRRLADLAPAHGARIDFVSFPDLSFPLPALAGRSVLARVRRLGSAALLVDSIAAAFLAPWLSPRARRVPLFAILHQPPGGMDHGAARTAAQARLDRALYARARLLLAASEPLAEQMRREGFGDRLVLAPPGRDVAPSPAGEPDDLRRGTNAAVLCVGNWIARKGILELLDAFARLAPDAACLHLVGDDGADPRYARAVRARLAEPDLAARVVVHGSVPKERVAALYAAADIFALASLKEPYGTVYGEAMAAGLPVVGWRAGNLPYLAEHGREGLIVPPGDVAGLASALQQLAADGGLRARMGEAARARAQCFPTWEETARKVFEAIRDRV